jgi:hypothetical protein
MSPTTQRATLAPRFDAETGAVAVLAVLAGNEAYGFPLSAVREILVPPPLTEVPRAPRTHPRRHHGERTDHYAHRLA